MSNSLIGVGDGFLFSPFSWVIQIDTPGAINKLRYMYIVSSIKRIKFLALGPLLVPIVVLLIPGDD